MNATDYLLWGMVVHFVCDWFLQNEWQAVNKTSLRHSAAWVHSGIHFGGLLLVFSPLVALGIAVTHLLIDTRKPLAWWAQVIRQTTDPANPVTIHLNFWRDQVAHIAVLAIAALLVGH